jgi:galactose-1-phosphate uridylyltransferase
LNASKPPIKIAKYAWTSNTWYKTVPFCAGFFFFFASPDEEGANVVAVFFTNLFKFLSNDDVEAEAEEDVVESLSPVASVAFSLSSFVAFKTKDDCFFRPPS